VVSHWPGGTKSEVPERINDVCCVGDPDGICSLRAFPLLTLSGCKRSDDLSSCYAAEYFVKPQAQNAVRRSMNQKDASMPVA